MIASAKVGTGVKPLSQQRSGRKVRALQGRVPRNPRVRKERKVPQKKDRPESCLWRDRRVRVKRWCKRPPGPVVTSDLGKPHLRARPNKEGEVARLVSSPLVGDLS